MYSPNGECSEQYPHAEWDVQNQVNRYYNEYIVGLTDEEFEELKQMYAKSQENTEGINKIIGKIKTPTDKNSNKWINVIVTTLIVIAVSILCVGFVQGIFVGNGAKIIENAYNYYSKNYSYSFSFGAAFEVWFKAIMDSVIYFAGAAIIKLLVDIKNK